MRNSVRPALRRLLLSEYFVLWLSVAYFLMAAPAAPAIASPQNLANLFASMLPLLVVTVGQTFVLVAGGIDLSVTATIALSSVCGGLLMTSDGGVLGGSGWAAAAGIAVMLVIGAALGYVNGFAVTRLGMPSFMVTLTTMMFFSGLAIRMTKSQSIYHIPAGFNAIGRGVPALLLAASVAVLAHLVLRRSRFGQWLYAIGMNPRTAMVSGLPVARTAAAAYVICGVYAALAGILYTARLETGSPIMGQRILLDVIGAAVIGGTSLFGGRGAIRGTLFGVLFVTLLDNSLNLMGLSFFLVLMAKGAVILGAALIDSARTRLLAAV